MTGEYEIDVGDVAHALLVRALFYERVKAALVEDLGDRRAEP